MMRIAMSPAAAGLLRALLARAGVGCDRILLTEFRSVDWQSLTFIGERHEFQLRILKGDAPEIVARMVEGLGEQDFAVPGHLVADIAQTREPEHHSDGSVTLSLEALTIVAD